MRASMPSWRAARPRPGRPRGTGALPSPPRGASVCGGSAGTWRGRRVANPQLRSRGDHLWRTGFVGRAECFGWSAAIADNRCELKKQEAAGASAPSGLQQVSEVAYADFIVVVTVLKVAPICEPRPRAAAMMPTAIRAAMRPYSMAVAPDSSFTKRSTWFFMTTLPFAGVAVPPGPTRGDNPALNAANLWRATLKPS